MVKEIPFTTKHEDMLISLVETSKKQSAQISIMLERMDKSDQRMDKSEQRMDKSDQRMDRMDKRMDRMDKRMDRMDKRMDKMDKRMDRMEQKLDNLGEQVHRNGLEVEAHRHESQQILEIVTHINKRFTQQDEIQEHVTNHENRISAIETHIKTAQ